MSTPNEDATNTDPLYTPLSHCKSLNKVTAAEGPSLHHFGETDLIQLGNAHKLNVDLTAILFGSDADLCN